MIKNLYKIHLIQTSGKIFKPLAKYEDNDQTGEANTVVGEEFWRVGKTGGAGQYSSGQGRSVLLKIFQREILGS